MWSRTSRCFRSFHSLTCAVSVALMGSGAHAGVVAIGGNWQAEWDGSLDGLVSITPISITGDTVHISKTAQFTQAPANGVFPTITILFRQLGASSVAHIVIDEESITNSTGVAWTAFRMSVLDSGNAAFNPALTAASGGSGPIGFAIAPFTVASFSGGNMDLDISGGVVNSGQTWTPGAEPSGGQLWIDVNSQAGPVFTAFTLKELPIPAPGTAALLALASLVTVHRPRRRVSSPGAFIA